MDHSHNERQDNESRSPWRSRTGLTPLVFLAIAAFDKRLRELSGLSALPCRQHRPMAYLFPVKILT